MDLKDRIKNQAKNYIKNKAKKKLKLLLLKLLIPWGLLIIIIVMTFMLLFNSIQESMAANVISDELTESQNKEITDYLRKKVEQTNKDNTYYKNSKLGYLADFYEFDKDLQIRVEQVKAYVKYLEINDSYSYGDEEDIYSPDANIYYNNTMISKVDRYKKLVDAACEELKPNFQYEKYTITTKRRYQERVYEYKELGNGLYDNNKNPIPASNYRIVQALPDISSVNVGDKFYLNNTGVYEVKLKADTTKLEVVKKLSGTDISYKGILIIPKDTYDYNSVFMYDYWDFFPRFWNYYSYENKYSAYNYIYAMDTNTLYKKDYYGWFNVISQTENPKISEMKIQILEGSFPTNLNNYDINTEIISYKNKMVKKVIKENGYKYYELISSSKPSNISNVMIFSSYSNLPNPKETKDGAMFYVFKENKTYITKSKLVPKEDPPSQQEIYVLIKGENIENTWETKYEMQTSTTTTTEPGIEGEVTYEVTRPVIKERNKTSSDFDKLKKIILNKNPDEEVATVVSMIRYANDTDMSWFFMDPSEVERMVPITVDGSSVPAQLQTLFNEVAVKSGIPAWLLMGIAKQESNFNPDAVSSVGAYGLMQILKYDNRGSNLWEYYLNTGLNNELKSYGYSYSDSEEAWSLYLSSAKVQIIAGAYVTKYYLNYVLWKLGTVSKFQPSNADNLNYIPWNSDNVADYRDIIRRALVCYNMGQANGMTANLDTNKYANTVFGYAMQYKGAGSLVEYAKKFLGTPYVWGGTTPDGFDCSGFVQYVYKHFGYNIPRTTKEQIKVGYDAPVDQLQPGDLLFFDTQGSGTPTDVSHVGMYIGDGMFIHAPRTGDVVKIVKFEGYYKQRFIKAKRFF